MEAITQSTTVNNIDETQEDAELVGAIDWPRHATRSWAMKSSMKALRPGLHAARAPDWQQLGGDRGGQ